MHHTTASSQGNGLWRFLEQRKANHSDPATPRLPSKDAGPTSSTFSMDRDSSFQHQAKPDPFNAANFVLSFGKERPGGSTPLHNYNEEPPLDLGALLRAEKTAQMVAASTSAAVERLSCHEQLEQTDPYVVNGPNSARGPLSSAPTVPDHQSHFPLSFSPENHRQRVTFGYSSREGELDLGAVQRAQLTARQVAQSTASAVEKLTQSLVPTSDDRPTNAI